MRGSLPHRKDKNHKEITDIFTKLNIEFIDLHTVGNGCPDILFSLCDYNFLVEIKNNKGILTEKEIKLISKWQGYIIVAYNIKEIFDGLYKYCKIKDDIALEVVVSYLENYYEKNLK